MKLKDKVVLITGGTTGIGAATARLFQSEGAAVIVTGSSVKTVEAAKPHLSGFRMAPHSDTVCRADFGAINRVFGGAPAWVTEIIRFPDIAAAGFGQVGSRRQRLDSGVRSRPQNR